jgi:hypothetical protein
MQSSFKQRYCSDLTMKQCIYSQQPQCVVAEYIVCFRKCHQNKINGIYGEAYSFETAEKNTEKRKKHPVTTHIIMRKQ